MRSVALTAVVLLAVLALFSMAAVTPLGTMQAAGDPLPPLVTTPPEQTFITDPVPEFKATGGPFITPDHALQVALRRLRPSTDVKAPSISIPRQAISLLSYGAIVTWSGGSRTYRIDLAREVYLVVLSTQYTPQHVKGAPTVCHWVAIVVDATDGTARELHCGELIWPATLPVGMPAQ